MIGRIIVSEVDRAARAKAARNRATPPRPAQPMSPRQILGVIACLALVIGPWIYLKTQSDDQSAATWANQQTCTEVSLWPPLYEPGLGDSLPRQIPDPALARDVQRLLGAIWHARVVNMAVVPDRQIREDLRKINSRCGQM